MTSIVETRVKRHLSAKFAVALAISAVLALGTFAGSASAQGRRHFHQWNGGYYPAPPVVYGSTYGNRYYGPSYGDPYYAPPPVVYGPGIGINLPGIGIRIGR